MLAEKQSSTRITTNLVYRPFARWSTRYRMSAFRLTCCQIKQRLILLISTSWCLLRQQFAPWHRPINSPHGVGRKGGASVRDEEVGRIAAMCRESCFPVRNGVCQYMRAGRPYV